MSKIGIIYGSSRPSTAGESVAKWFVEKVDFGSNDVEFIDLSKLQLPAVAEMTSPMMVQDSNYENETTKSWAAKISSLDAVVFVAAEYNLGYTPLLKNAIDLLFHEWSEKSVAFISYGAYPKSTAVEQLRTVMSPFKTKQVTETLHVTPVYEAIGEDGVIDESKINGDDAQKIANELLASLS